MRESCLRDARIICACFGGDLKSCWVASGVFLLIIHPLLHFFDPFCSRFDKPLSTATRQGSTDFLRDVASRKQHTDQFSSIGLKRSRLLPCDSYNSHNHNSSSNKTDQSAEMERSPWWMNLAHTNLPTWSGPVGVKADGGGSIRGQGRIGPRKIFNAVHNRRLEGKLRGNNKRTQCSSTLTLLCTVAVSLTHRHCAAGGQWHR